MKFLAIKPKDKKLVWIDTNTLKAAEVSAGLVSVDHGMFWRNPNTGKSLAYVVYEYGFFVRPDKQTYAIVFGKLIAGNCVCYAVNEIGDTINVESDMISEKDVTWLPTQYDVEIAIAKGQVNRPIIAVNGVIEWKWPEPAPAQFKVRE